MTRSWLRLSSTSVAIHLSYQNQRIHTYFLVKSLRVACLSHGSQRKFEMENVGLRRGCRVRLTGLSTAILNGAGGVIVGPLDEQAGRHPVKLLKPPKAVATFKDGVKVKPANLERIVQESHSSRKPKDRHPTMNVRQYPSGTEFKPPGQAAFDPASWAVGLAPPQQQEWLVDCYRMRVDDDYAWGGGQLRGLYGPDGTRDDIVNDFFVFCKLAVANRVITPALNWNWRNFLLKARELLPYAFEKVDAKEKYGGENFFSGALGGRSLRMTGEAVYGTSCMNVMAEQTEARVELEEMVESGGVRALLESRAEVFTDVGGGALWRELLDCLPNRVMIR